MKALKGAVMEPLETSTTDLTLPIATTPSKPRQRPDCFLAFCRVVNVITATSALLCLVAHSMALASALPLLNREQWRLQVMRAYGVGIAALLMLLETEWPWLLDHMRLLEAWLGRALVQGLLVIMTLELATSNGSSDFDKSIRLYRQVAGYCMLGCAAFYAIGGLLCFGAIRRARYRIHAERQRMERDLQALDMQREELKGLLSAYTRE